MIVTIAQDAPHRTEQPAVFRPRAGNAGPEAAIGLIARVICIGALGALLAATPGLSDTRSANGPRPIGIDAKGPPPIGIDVQKLTPVYKPHKFTPLEGYRIKRIDWKSWGNRRARGLGRFRVPESPGLGHESGPVDVQVKLSGPKACPVYDQSGNEIGEIVAFTRAKLTSVGKPGRCAVICVTGSPGYDVGCI